VLPLKTATFFVALCLCFNSFGQQPSHFIIGGDVFANSHVYSLLMHSDNLLYAATNYGLFVYKNGQFQAIEGAPEEHGSALFSLVENKKGEVYCCNLAGQIFKLKNNKLELYVKLPEEYLGNAIEISFNSQDELIVCSQVYLRYDSKRWHPIYKPESGASSINAFDRNRILIPKGSAAQVLRIHGSSIDTLSTDNPFFLTLNDYFQYPAYLNNSLVSFYNSGLFINHSKKILKRYDFTNIRAFQQLDDNEIWAFNETKGVRRISLEDGYLKFDKTILSESFISACTKSKSGTMYFGTFNQGIIVIPNMSSLVLENKDNFYSGICASPKGLIVTGRLGSIYQVSLNKFELLKEQCTISRGKIKSVSGVDFNLLSNHKSLIFDVKNSDLLSEVGLVKAVTRVDSTTAIVATSRGLFRRGSGASQFNWIPTRYNPGWTEISSKTFRCNAVAYDAENGALFYATEKGLVYIAKNGETKIFLYKGSPIDCIDLVYDRGNIWCGTQALGILKIRNGKIVHEINKTNGMASNYIRSLQLHGNKLFISQKTGFQIVDLVTNKWKSIGGAEGIINGSINNFAVFQGDLWIVSKGQIISLKLNQLEKKPDFSLDVSSVQLGDSLLKEKLKSTLSYDQNHFVARFNFRGIEFESEAVIQYRLIGISDEWKNLAATTSELEFNALAPNNYQFEVRIKYRDFESEIQRYSFTIQVPFWQAWWFYSLLILATACCVIIFFRFRLKRSRIEQSRQLNQQKMQTNMLDSELKALRSQMNPHFIFNSLNSIQDLILREDKEKSYDYIVLFAKLVRNTLSYSNMDFIPIEKELEFLDVYLSLEKLRFGDNFEYAIHYNGSKNVNVPSMLVQPFIENALVHGLIHKKGLKKLDVTFNQSKGLTCTVIDNGVGRVKADEIQFRQRGNHASFALTAIQQRLEILNLQLGEEIGKYDVTDLYENKKPVGTRVDITIPFRN
jgi:hypothetical protein